MVCFVHFDFEMCLTPQWRAICHLSFGPWLRTRRFSEPTFRPSGAINHFTVFRDFLTSFSSLIFFLLLFPSLTLPISAFHMSILSENWLPNFLRSIGYEFYTKGSPLEFPLKNGTTRVVAKNVFFAKTGGFSTWLTRTPHFLQRLPGSGFFRGHFERE